MSRCVAVALLAVMTLLMVASSVSQTQPAQNQNDEVSRRVKNRVEPIYPELAKRMRLSGIVKIEVVIATNGSVKEARIIGGHPVLANAALDAAKRWRFEPGPTESSGVIDFKFDPQ